MTGRIISADSHVNLSHQDIKAHLAARFHDEYDRAFSRWTDRRGDNDGRPKVNLGSHMSRPGYRDAAAHIVDMDTDGIDAEIVYCEVSAFRYLYLMSEGGPEATRAFNDALGDYGSVDPKRLIVSYQIPNSRYRQCRVRGRAGRRHRGEVVAAAGVSDRTRPARLHR